MMFMEESQLDSNDGVESSVSVNAERSKIIIYEMGLKNTIVAAG